MNRHVSPSLRQSQFLAACHLDVLALKPGNVRVGAPAHGMSADDFLRSAEASAPALDEAGATVGQRVLGAVQRTQSVVRCNTNLGIVLLAAPLFRAAEQQGAPLRTALVRELDSLSHSDAVLVYQAIRLARPGGLGTSARYDVGSEPQVTLLQAMREAKQRDSIARQYARGFCDIFDLGLPRWHEALARSGSESTAAAFVYLVYLSTWRDTLIERKFGAATAQAVSERARELCTEWVSSAEYERIEPKLLEWDRELRQSGLNPGTSADLTVATAFAAKLSGAV